jgi:hypothetical protein
MTDQLDEVVTADLSGRKVCPNCGGELHRDLAPRLPLVPVRDGKRRIYRYCVACFKKLVLIVIDHR